MDWQVIRRNTTPQGLAVGAALVVFIAIAGWNISNPGLYYDELLFVDAALGQPNGIFRYINFGPVPVMLMTYIGALKAWLYYALFKVFAVSAMSVRLPMVLLGAFTLWLNYKMLLHAFSRPVALVFLAMAAVEPATLFHTRLDWGPTALMMLCRALMLLATVLWLKTQQPKYLLALLAAALFGTFDKLNFLWLCLSLAMALMIVYPHLLFEFCKRHPRFCIGTGATLVLLALGLLNYMSSAVPMAEEVGATDWSYRFLVVKQLLQSTVQGTGVYEVVTAGTAISAIGQPQLWALGIALVAGIIVAWPQHHTLNGRMTAFFGLFSAFVLLALFVTKQATGPHHTATLAPLWLVFLAVLLGHPFADAHGHRWAKVLAGFAIALVCLSSLRVDAINLQGFANNPKSNWDRGSEALVAEIRRHPGRLIITADWGSGTIINGLLNGEVTLYDDWGSFLTYPDLASINHYETLIAQRAPLFVLPSASTANFPQARQNIMQLAEARQWQPTLEASINGHDGQPLYLLYSVTLPSTPP